MALHIEEMTTTVDITSAAASVSASATSANRDSLAERERARRSAERALRITRRTQAEGYDD